MPVTMVAPAKIYFQDTSTPDITAWLWMFGDGNTSTDPNPTHIYSTPGVYVVTLEATGPLGVLVFQDIVTVMTEGLIHNWTLSESTGTREDNAGTADLTEVGTVGTTHGLGGANAADFTSGYLVTSQDFSVPQDFTFSLWFKSPTAGTRHLLFIPGQFSVSILENRIYFEVDGWATPEASWRVGIVDDGAWHHVIGWVDTDQDMNIHLAFDGDETGGTSIESLSGTRTVTPARIDVGFGIDGSTSTGLFMQRVAIFNRALTAPERAARWNSGLGMDEVTDESATLNVWTQPDLAYVQWPPGSEPQIMLRMSNDGGKNWGPELWRPVGKVGQYGKRVRWNRLGSGRQRVFEVSVTDPIEWKITAAYLKANQGES